MSYDIVAVGSSFATTFFLHEYLRRSGQDKRVLVLEKGGKQERSTGSPPFVNRTPEKEWISHLVFGGNSNFWWGCTPRMLEDDFHMQSRFGVGFDWPVSYSDLESFYCQAEEIMEIAGPTDGGPVPRSRPYPLPSHLFTDPDKALKQAFPDTFFSQACARPTRATKNRPACRAIGACTQCPIDSKFTIPNELNSIYQDPRVELVLDADARRIETQGNVATGITYQVDGIEVEARGDLILLGANAIFNPFLMLKSGMSHPLLGKRLQEQASVHVNVTLDGMENFQGSTSITGNGYMLYKNRDRANLPAAMIETFNVPKLRDVRGKWRQRLGLKVIFENLPEESNYVGICSDDPSRPEVVFQGHSSYAERGIESLGADLPEILRSLPTEGVSIANETSPGEGHIIGTTVMGIDPQSSVIDRHLVHHQFRNLVVLGCGAFPTGPPANPTLTMTALSLWSAHALLS